MNSFAIHTFPYPDNLSITICLAAVLIWAVTVYTIVYCNTVDMINIDRQLIPSFWSHIKSSRNVFLFT